MIGMMNKLFDVPGYLQLLIVSSKRRCPAAGFLPQSNAVHDTRLVWLLVLVFVLAPAYIGSQTNGNAVPPPRPFLPIPAARQLSWQRDELRLFLHFGINTFTDREWGTGEEDPAVFNPSRLDARQWARIAKESGFRTLILTAKHHDGFALWPSRYTDHSVEGSPWKGGKGDVVRELVDAAGAEGLKVGLYLSPWDRHEPSYGDEAAYNAFYLGQLRELLTDYGPLAEVWFDGAKGKDAKDMTYDFDAYWALVRQLQPGAVIFSDAGPDVRWIGNEHGFAGATNWSTYDRSKVGVGIGGMTDYLNSGEAGAPDWVPGECDVSIRSGWFWHPEQQPKAVDELLDIYFKSVGRGSVLLLNVPPNTQGLIADSDAKRLREFRAAIDRIFADNLAEGARASASKTRGGSSLYGAMNVLDGSMDSYWTVNEGVTQASIELDLGAEKTFNVVMLREPVQFGQRVSRYRFEKWQNGSWQPVIRGTTIGYKRLERLEAALPARRVRLTIEQALAEPLIAEVGLYYDATLSTP